MRTKVKCRFLILSICLIAGWHVSSSTNVGDTVRWEAGFIGAGSTGNWAPYYIGSNSGGRHAMKGTADVYGFIGKEFNSDKRFSWTAGAEVAAGYESSADYERYDADVANFVSRQWHPARATVYQLWAGVKYRGVNLWVGMRDHKSLLVDDELSTGDLTLSNNARAVPQAEIGFVDFQNIPFTKGWVQIMGGISYGKFTDNASIKGRYNYWNDHIALGTLFTYKYIYFRTPQDKPFAVTIGAQAAGEFGGTSYYYALGNEFKVVKQKQNLRAFWEMIIPTKRFSDGFVEGNHVGSWNLKANYRFRSGYNLEGYFQWHWDDGSAMAKRNKWDGLWGVTLSMPDNFSIVRKVLVEYIDMRDQSGPIHWAPSDAPGTTITTEASGGDNYYNSSSFNAWANYGLALGSSFPLAPLYNADGFPQFKYTRTQGVHIAAAGKICPTVDWTAKFSYGIAHGNGRIPYPGTLRNASAMLSAQWDASCVLKGFGVGGSVAFDAGSLRGDNFGVLVKAIYTGDFAF